MKRMFFIVTLPPIEGDTMRWSALREDENGQRHTATFETKRALD